MAYMARGNVGMQFFTLKIYPEPSHFPAPPPWQQAGTIIPLML